MAPPFACTVSSGVVRRRLVGSSGMTLIELLIAIVVLGILLVLAIGAVRRARASANEGSALASLKLVGQAEVNYSAVCGRGGFAASLALSVLMLPTVTRTTEVVLRLVPGGLREAGLALGATEWKTTRDRKSTRLNSSHVKRSRMPSSA